MAVWLSGSLRKNCFTSPSTNDTMVDPNSRAEEVVIIRLEEEETTVGEMRAEARMMVMVASILRIAQLPPQLWVPIFHCSQITKRTFYLKLREIRFLENRCLKSKCKSQCECQTKNRKLIPVFCQTCPAFSLCQFHHSSIQLLEYSIPPFSTCLSVTKNLSSHDHHFMASFEIVRLSRLRIAQHQQQWEGWQAVSWDGPHPFLLSSSS